MFFMSLLNSNNPMFITGFQAMGAPIVRRYNLEAIFGYIIVGEGSTAAYVGQAHAIPLKKPEVASLYALAAQYIGMVSSIRGRCRGCSPEMI
jgi:phosphoglycerol geranylgeranyltransferase